MAKETVAFRVGEFLKENPGKQFSASEIADLLGIDRDRKLLLPQNDNPLVNAPHPYPRAQAAYPANWVRTEKYWPPVSRTDAAYGDRNLACTWEK